MATPFPLPKILLAAAAAALFLAGASLRAQDPAPPPHHAALLDKAADTVGGRVSDFWNTPLFTLSDPVRVNGQIVQRASSVTLGMIVTALAILLVGGIFSAGFSRWLRSRLSKRFRLEPTTGAIVQKFTNYSLLFLVSLLALAAVRIPLTIFALLGGAAAIAVGFGAQQLVNNLISGLILLFERPIRIGDRIEVGTFLGTVTAIGSRCCQLHRDDGVEILIPNSVILQGTVVNHTLKDDSSRNSLAVSLAADAPVEQAMEVLRDLAAANPAILKNRGLDVSVQEISASKVDLRISFWMETSSPDGIEKAQSELRLAILRRFQAEGIALA
jgi:potassium-dependent mechanosensitive channel